MAQLIPTDELKSWLDAWAQRYEQVDFIPLDPISIPHRYERPEDIECVAFMTATIAWGRRASILQSAHRMFEPMGASPVAFLVDANANDLMDLVWAHRTFYLKMDFDLCSRSKGGINIIIVSPMDSRCVREKTAIMRLLIDFATFLHAHGWTPGPPSI